MEDFTFTNALAYLNDELDDADNFTFTADEKTRALTRAWNDRFVVAETYDNQLVYDPGYQMYELPAGTRNVIKIGQDFNGSGFETEIPRSGFDIVANHLKVDPNYRYVLDSGKPIYVWAWCKLTTEDEITDYLLQEYVLKLAQFNTLSILRNKRANRFLKNDASMGELLNLAGELKREIMDYRKQHRVIAQEL